MAKTYFDYTGKVVAITGASSGLGKQMAEGFAAVHANLVLLARRIERLESLAAELKATYGIDAIAVKCDVTSDESIAEAVKTVKEHFGHCEVIVNDAGGEKGTGTPLLDFVDSDWDFTLNLDLTSVFKVTRGFCNLMKDAMKEGKQSYGRVINIASMYGLVGNKIAPASPYHAAKGGVVNLTRALAAEWGKYGITVNTICPGYFITPLTKETLESEYFANYAKTVIPMERYGHAGELDSAVVFLASDASTYVTGVALPVDGGYTCV